jgi:hypothetical protein
MDNDLKDWSKNDLVREVGKLRQLLSDQLKAAPGTGPSVEVQGIVSSTSNMPYVQMRAGEAAWQMTPAQARQHAFLVMDAAVESERDAATIAFLEEMNFGEESASQYLLLMREHRKDWFKEFKKMDSVVEGTEP